MNNSPLRYSDDTDRAYGVAGMSIAMVLWDGQPFLASVSIDSPIGESIRFTPAFGFSGNPRLMASFAWRQHIKEFELTTAMIMSNAICRSYVRHAAPLSDSMSKALREIIRTNGYESCQLDDDEIDLIYNKTRRYLDRVFSHSGVSAIAHNLAQTLQLRRNMSAAEVFDILSALDTI